MADHVIPDFDQTLASTPQPSDEERLTQAGNLRAMMHGLLCGRCVLDARIDLNQLPAEWQAVTIIDGTALCAQHVIVKAREDAEAGGGRSLDERLAAIEERLRGLEQAADAQREYEREMRDRGE